MALQRPTLFIKHKIWLGFGSLLLLLLVIALTSVFSSNKVQSGVSRIIDQDQPAVLIATELATALEKTSANLGYLLLSKEAQYREDYQNELAGLEDTLQRLQANELIKTDAELNQLAADIQEDIAKFRGYQARMLELVDSQAKNFPGIQFAAQQINPISQQMLNQITQFLISEAEEDVSEERRPLVTAVNDLRYKWANVMNGVRAYLAFRSASGLQEIALYKEDTERLSKLIIEEYGDLLGLDQEEAINRFIALSQQFFTNFEELKKIHGSPAWRTDAHLIRTEVGPLLKKVQAELNTLVTRLTANINSTNNGLLDDVTATKSTIIVFSLIALVLGIAGAVLMSLLISRPLTAVATAMRDISHGEGDLTQRLTIRSRDEIGQLSDAFNQFVDQIHDVISDVKQAFGQLSAASTQMTTVIAETGQSVNDQRLATDQVATAVNELNATAVQMSDTSADTAKAASEANDQTQSGKQVVGKTIEVINALSAEINSASEIIRKVGDDSNSIDTVLDVIRGIAEQTNLLALNAAIEAARAGEQGRGFAVVADEVRTLASRTQDSTQEIQAMIETLQAASRQAVNAMESSRNQASNGVDQAAEAGEALDRIAGSVDTITSMNMQVATAAKEQDSVVEEIARNITHISDISDLTSQRSEQLATTSEQVNQAAAQLENLVGRFKVRGG